MLQKSQTPWSNALSVVLCFLRLFDLVEDNPSGTRFPGEEHRVGVDVQRLVTLDRPVRAIRHPSGAVSPVRRHQTLPETLGVSLTSLQWQFEALHVLLELCADGDGARHGAKRQRMRLAP